MERNTTILNDYSMGNGMRNLAKHMFWILLVQALVLVGLGLLVLAYPAILFVLVAATLIWNGAMMLVIAWRIRAARGTHEVRDLIEAVA